MSFAVNPRPPGGGPAFICYQCCRSVATCTVSRDGFSRHPAVSVQCHGESTNFCCDPEQLDRFLHDDPLFVIGFCGSWEVRRVLPSSDRALCIPVGRFELDQLTQIFSPTGLLIQSLVGFVLDPQQYVIRNIEHQMNIPAELLFSNQLVP